MSAPVSAAAATEPALSPSRTQIAASFLADMVISPSPAVVVHHKLTMVFFNHVPWLSLVQVQTINNFTLGKFPSVLSATSALVSHRVLSRLSWPFLDHTFPIPTQIEVCQKCEIADGANAALFSDITSSITSSIVNALSCSPSFLFPVTTLALKPPESFFLSIPSFRNPAFKFQAFQTKTWRHQKETKPQKPVDPLQQSRVRTTRVSVRNGWSITFACEVLLVLLPRGYWRRASFC